MSSESLPKLGYYRTCYDNTRADKLRDMPEGMRAMYLLYTYASKTNPDVRYVRADLFIRAHPVPGLSTEMELIREVAHRLADHFVHVVHGENAMRINNHSLDVSLHNVQTVTPAA